MTVGIRSPDVATNEGQKSEYRTALSRLDNCIIAFGGIGRDTYNQDELSYIIDFFQSQNEVYQLCRSVYENSSQLNIRIFDHRKAGHTSITIYTVPTSTKATIDHPPQSIKGLNLNKRSWDRGKYVYTTDSHEESKKILDYFYRQAARALNIEGPKLSRRDLLILGSSAAASFGVAFGVRGLMGRLTQYPADKSDNLTPATLYKDQVEFLEKNMGILLEEPSTGVCQYRGVDGKNYPTVDWDSPHLEFLLQALLKLPPYFYTPQVIDGKIYKRRFALVDYTPQTVGGWCDCSNQSHQLIALVNKYTVDDPNWTRKSLIHELTHAVTQPNIQLYIDGIAKPLGLNTEDDLHQVFASANDDHQIKYGATNFYEFFSVAATNYVDGTETFIKAYEYYLGKEKTELFYISMKKLLFRGKEY